MKKDWGIERIVCNVLCSRFVRSVMRSSLPETRRFWIKSVIKDSAPDSADCSQSPDTNDMSYETMLVLRASRFRSFLQSCGNPVCTHPLTQTSITRRLYINWWRRRQEGRRNREKSRSSSSSSRDDAAAVCQNHSIIINATLSWCLDEGRGKKNHSKQLTGEDRIEEGSHDDLHNNKQRHKLRKQNSDLSYNCRESCRKERNIQQAAAERVV